MPTLKEIYDQRYGGEYRERLSGFEVARWEALGHFITRVPSLNGASMLGAATAMA